MSTRCPIRGSRLSVVIEIVCPFVRKTIGIKMIINRILFIVGCHKIGPNVSVVGNVGELRTEHLSHDKLVLKY